MAKRPVRNSATSQQRKASASPTQQQTFGGHTIALLSFVGPPLLQWSITSRCGIQLVWNDNLLPSVTAMPIAAVHFPAARTSFLSIHSSSKKKAHLLPMRLTARRR